MRRVIAFELKPGMIVAEPIFSLDHKQILVNAGSELTEKVIQMIINWDVPYVMVSEQGEAGLLPDEKRTEDIEQEVAALPEVLAKKTIDFVQNLEAAISQVAALLEETRENKAIDLEQFRNVAVQVAGHLIQPSEAINKMLFRIPSRTSRDYLAYHSVAVAALSGMLADWLELSPGAVADVVLAGVLHDAGKTQIPRSLIADADPTPDRREIIEQHVLLAVQMLKEQPRLAQDVLVAIMQHHERLDGSGYPLGLTENDIRQYARIIALADRLCNIAADAGRVNPFTLLETIKNEMFAKLDPTVTDTFIRRFTDYLMNNPVKLNDGRKAKVVFLPGVNPTSPVLQTENEEFIDLTKNKEVKIMGLTI
ncbi:MAG TPA: HD domain-containing phosphohydrolase [Selenomonadales bacterium]|nr:HD domain-containing phosphohydrolase [Selenomonadales bacterium]